MSTKNGKSTDVPPRFPDHTGKATWGERTVPIEEFRTCAAASGRSLQPEERRAAARAFLAANEDETAVEGPFDRIVVFGGVYNNHFALSALLEAAAAHRAKAVFCLGDLGGFGPNPERIRPLLDQGGIRCIQGNYEQSLSAGADDCNCGYTDPRDNHFAALSYDYTARRTSAESKAWMGRLPLRRRVAVGERELLLVHGSPRRVNEFLFESTTPDAYLEVLVARERCDGFLCTHTGLHWERTLSDGAAVANVGVIGRPANDGRRSVRYALIEARQQGVAVQLLPLEYDWQGLAREMVSEDLPREFVETIRSGWWTTCLEILPARERIRSRF